VPSEVKLANDTVTFLNGPQCRGSAKVTAGNPPEGFEDKGTASCLVSSILPPAVMIKGQSSPTQGFPCILTGRGKREFSAG
jgi:hypothetical protein